MAVALASGVPSGKWDTSQARARVERNVRKEWLVSGMGEMEGRRGVGAVRASAAMVGPRRWDPGALLVVWWTVWSEEERTILLEIFDDFVTPVA